MSESRRGRGAGSIICTVLGIVLLVAVIATCIPMIVPRIMGNEVYTVVSGSMEPTIPVGSLVIVTPTAGQELEVGDVAAYASGESVITHRVVENHVVDGELITQGDANPVEDAEPISYNAVIGKVTTHIPVIGAYMDIFSSMIGKIYLLGAAVCGLLFIVLGSRLKRAY